MGDKSIKNFKMIVQYEGTRYKGWQRQESTENTIQGKLESIFSKLEERPVEITGSGRTDAGVHAYGQVINVFLATDMSEQEIMNYVNQYLPVDIAVIEVRRVSERFHSRLNATKKTYLYRVMNSHIPHVFEERYVYVLPEKLDLEAMKTAASYLLGKHDFLAFSTKKKKKKSTVRNIDDIVIKRVGDEIQFLYIGNGFLYHMVRIMTGTLLEVGLGKRKPEDIIKILRSCDRESAGMLVPAKGLALVSVDY